MWVFPLSATTHSVRKINYQGVLMPVFACDCLQKATSGGGRFMIWFVSNLNGTSVSLFLFGEAYDARWKESEGTVVAILNPKRKEDKPGSSSSAQEQRGPAYTVSNAGQVLVIGRVSDLNFTRVFNAMKC
jgi:hypothetical protein